ncbi:MAG: right-handed parallel beta-helix repeat-containing protein [Planctomycetota bacterium]|jgi:parallel beta-helix repeat protein
MNHPGLIRTGGQYAVLPPGPDGRRKVVLWPLDTDSLVANVTCSVRKVGFNVNGKSHVHVDGFKIRRYSGSTDDLRAGNGILNLAHTPTSGVVVRNCEVLQCKAGSGYWAVNCAGCNDSIIEHNFVHHNQMNRGVSVRGSTSHKAKNVTIRNNRVERCGGTGITFYHVDDSRIVGNTVVGNRGNHANGITCYLHSRNILISGNRVLNGNMAITVQQSSDVTVSNNLLSGRDGQSRILVLYGRGERISVLNNTILNSSTGGGISVPDDARQYTIRNNVTDGMLHGRNPEQMAGVVLENNLYTKLSWVQRPETLGANAIVEKDLSKIFVAPDKGDYRLRPDSPARDAGTPVPCTHDIDGVKRPQGNAFDLGAYEYQENPD